MNLRIPQPNDKEGADEPNSRYQQKGCLCLESFSTRGLKNHNKTPLSPFFGSKHDLWSAFDIRKIPEKD